jgi:Fis family transcriptional regulator
MNQEAVALNSSFAEPASTTESALPSEQKSGLPNGQTIRDCVATALDNYFSSLDKSDGIFEVYQMVMAEVEAPLLEAVMKHTEKNQTRSSEILGINRGTLRKKLKQYDML